jgi:hypothetical protein
MAGRANPQITVINEVRAAHAALERSAESAFREYATQTAFMLTLSKNQVRALLWLDRMGTYDNKPNPRDEGLPDSFISAVRGLIRRGLIVHYYPEKKHPAARKGWYPYKVTKIGRLVAELCRIAGGPQ